MRTRTEVKEDIDAWENGEPDALKSYDEMLNDVYGMVSVAGYEYETARTLEEIDPTAYNTGFNDYADSVLTDLYDELEDAENDEERTFYCAVSSDWNDPTNYYLEVVEDIDELSPGALATLNGVSIGIVKIEATSQDDALEGFKARFPTLKDYSLE